MNKAIVALDSSIFFKEIKAIEKLEVYEHDITYMEGVLEYISKNEVNVLITKDTLEGEMTKEIYLKQIKLLKPNCKVILYTKETDERYHEFLHAIGIYLVLDIRDINIIKLKEVINFKSNISKYNKLSSERKYDTDMVQVLTKKKIAIFGTNGAGKSYVSYVLSLFISKRLNIKNILLDFDLQNSAIDIYGNLKCDSNILKSVVENVENNTLDIKKLEQLVYKKNVNTAYLTNNSAIYEYQNTLNVSHYKKIIEVASKIYDAILIDTPSSLYIDVTRCVLKEVDDIVFVVNPNYISIRQALKYLEFIENIWGINSNKIKIVINKIAVNSLTTQQVSNLLKRYNIWLEIKYDLNLEDSINGMKEISLNNINNIDKIYKLLGINKYINSKKLSLLNKLFNKEVVKC
ncbi:MAG: hypothetical protein PHD20_00745 [Clostridia bacterium]|nr:hypothetical protein [Clostridia bacterium]